MSLVSTSDDDYKKFLLEHSYTRPGPDGQQVIGLNIGLPNRTIGRLRRCGNCVHFNTEDKARSHYRQCRASDEQVFLSRGMSLDSVAKQLFRMDRIVLDGLGVVGLCTNRDARTDEQRSSDFCHHKYICDRWTGRVIFGPQDGPIDPLPEEVWDRLGDKVAGRKED